MGHLCLLGALCCTYAAVTFRKYCIFTKHLTLNVISTLMGIITCPTPVVTTYCAKIKTKITGNNLNTVFI